MWIKPTAPIEAQLLPAEVQRHLPPEVSRYRSASLICISAKDLARTTEIMDFARKESTLSLRRRVLEDIPGDA